MNENKLNPSEVFYDYRVGEASGEKDVTCGMITQVDIKKIGGSDKHPAVPTYDVILTVLVDVDNELKSYQKTFKGITLNGRRNFQEFIQKFALTGVDANGVPELHLEKLINQICAVTLAVGRRKNIAEIDPADFDCKETEEYYCNLFADSKVEAGISEVPYIISHYTIIPAVKPYEEFRDAEEYHANIERIDCFKDANNPTDVTIRVRAYLFNGGDVREFDMYFNCVHSSGKKAFDAFCKEFGIVDDKGRVLYQGIEGQFCTAELVLKNRKLYIQSLEPLAITSKAVKEQYMDIIAQMNLSRCLI